MKKLTDDIIKKSRDAYLRRYNMAPEQFNIAYSETDGWRVEFYPNATGYSEGFVTWYTGAIVLDLFFSCDADKVDLLSWEEVWNDE